MTGSIGIVIPSRHADAGTVLRDADTAMYQAKDAGRNRYALFDEDRAPPLGRTPGDGGRATPGAGPRTSSRSTTNPSSSPPAGGRWAPRPWSAGTTRRAASSRPLEFIPVAEDSGLIKPVGRWVFEQALSQLASWDAEDDGPRLDFLAVNLSARQLDDAETSDMVRDVLERYRIDPEPRVCGGHRVRRDGRQRTRPGARWTLSRTSGCEWRSTISAPGTLRWPTFTRCP